MNYKHDTVFGYPNTGLIPAPAIEMEKVRKEVHLPLLVVHDLKIVAAHADKSVKKFMEDLILYEVRMQILKLNNKSEGIVN